ncbi:hypothetical protein DAY19_12435 [Halobacteriovorax vibrionivorans]|uniref:PepSY domain-containing protein n=1 Tax=Halobacteriovorax vibrionivorans TaxID=2152716 RepID=A0ABY0IDT7_9BACT|nr:MULTISPECIES: hypothetical protein [Halobacteriovorax]RZF20787.1 hypothetical protein DAY19_12435 [Halobacteriovorax vibrionivorans]TGD48171.1 hypothetical protein EP118_04535 [Halobacteriovorax sp. Y22]
MKKALVIGSFFVAGLFIISSYQNEESNIVTKSKVQADKAITKNTHKHHHNKKVKSRSIASLDTSLNKKPHKVETETPQFGRIKKELTESDIEVINKVKSNIPALADSEFEIVKRLRISNKSIYIVNQTFNGLPQSFTALIDNKSGRIEKSWGKTRYEMPQATRHYPATTY